MKQLKNIINKIIYKIYRFTDEIFYLIFNICLFTILNIILYFSLLFDKRNKDYYENKLYLFVDSISENEYNDIINFTIANRFLNKLIHSTRFISLVMFCSLIAYFPLIAIFVLLGTILLHCLILMISYLYNI
jgi:hypothetical protein